MDSMSQFMVMFRRRVCDEHHRPPLGQGIVWQRKTTNGPPFNYCHCTLL